MMAIGVLFRDDMRRRPCSPDVSRQKIVIRGSLGGLDEEPLRA
jgi:hypothetical protein